MPRGPRFRDNFVRCLIISKPRAAPLDYFEMSLGRAVLFVGGAISDGEAVLGDLTGTRVSYLQ